MNRGYILLPIFILVLAYRYSPDKKTRFDDGPQLEDLFFIANEGQWDDPYLYKASLGAAMVYSERHRLTYSLIDPETLPFHGSRGAHAGHHGHEVSDEPYEGLKGHAFRILFEGASDLTTLKGDDRRETFHNYFLGNDESKWRSNVGLYGTVYYEDLYDNINLSLYQKDGLFKYDFIVEPQADASEINLVYEGVDDLYLHEGNLHVITSVNTIIEKKPYSYQIISGKKVTVESKFVQSGNTISFNFPKGYDKNHQLIIDPVLVFSSYTGSFGDNFGVTAAFDQLGNGYAAGTVYAPGYPTTVGAFQMNFHGSDLSITDVGISKFSPDGSTLVYSTYLGGLETDVPHSLIVNGDNELTILGTTSSSDFPTSIGAYDRSFNGGPVTGGLSTATPPAPSLFFNAGADIFITTLSANGTALVGSTFLGGSNTDGLNAAPELRANYGDEFRGEVITDAGNNVYIASMSASTDFPTTLGAYDENKSDNSFDIILAKFNPGLTQLLFSTYYGGSEDDVAYSMKLDNNQNIYFAGGTQSLDLPTSATAIEPTFRGGVSDGFVGKISADGSTLLAATYLGTSNTDQAFFVELDPAQDVFIVGDSRGGNYPVTPGRFANPGSTQFLHKMKPDLDSTFFTTVFGNGSPIRSLSLDAFMIDDCDRIYVSGWGGNVNPDGDVNGMPITSDAFKPTTDGSDFYFIVFNVDASSLVYATYYGGSLSPEHVDGGTSRFDRRGIIYQAVCAGCGGNSAFPTSTGAYSRINNSPNCNLALIKFDFQLSDLNVGADADPFATGCAPLVVNFDNLTTGPVDRFEWHFGDGDMSTLDEPTHTYDVGTFNVTLIGISDQTCIDPDTAYLTIEVLAQRDARESSFIKCAEEVLTLTSPLSGAIRYEWKDGSTSQSLDVLDAGVYWVRAYYAGSCFELDSFIVEHFPTPSTSQSIEGCVIEDYVVASPFASATATYAWQDGSTNETFRIRDAGVFWVRVSEPGICDRIDSFVVEEYPLKDPIIHDFELCPGKSTTVQATDRSNGATHIWQDGSTGDSLVINTDGIYWVVTSFPTECDQIDSFIVSPAELFPSTLDSFRICEDTDLTLGSQHVDDGASYLWSTGETTPTIDVSRTGFYEVVTDFNRICPLTNQYYVRAFPVIDENDIYFPNAFSPNNDGINELFRPYFSDLVEVLSYEFKVFDRWGKKVFETANKDAGWDGIYQNQAEAVAVYVWYAKVNLIACTGEPMDVIMKGDVTLLR